jgi:hypothetical protein
MSHIATDTAFFALLAARVRSSEIAEADDLYGFLVGDWELDVVRYRAIDVSARGIKGEVHAAWVLEGRAIQDVWIMPRVADRTAALDRNLNMYGSTLRAWDSSIRAWRIRWSNPAHDHHEEQIGRRSGNDIVQLGTRPNGVTTRWRFIERTGDSFHWIGEALNPDGQTWTLEGEFRARRTSV